VPPNHPESVAPTITNGSLTPSIAAPSNKPSERRRTLLKPKPEGGRLRECGSQSSTRERFADGKPSNVASYCAGNRNLVFGLSVAFAAPTLELLGEASGGFHFHGYSSKGKTKILAVSASVFGFPMMTWRTTDNALENTAERHNSVLLALDELSQIDPRKAVDTALQQRAEPRWISQEGRWWGDGVSDFP